MRAPWLTFGLLLLSPATLFGGEILDRIVANVNGHVILQSDWDDELHYECFMGGRALEDLTPEDRNAALDRLIDQELVREQMRTAEIKPTTPGEIDKYLEAVKTDYIRNQNARSWTTALSAYGLTEIEIRERVALELNQLRLVDARLRPSIQIDAAAVESYYKELFLPELNHSGGQQIPLKEAASGIREILTQQKINQMLGSWLESLRSQSQVQWLVSDSPERQGHTP
jgi:peptidyl-prolyl cis-trans isomerase SurA